MSEQISQAPRATAAAHANDRRTYRKRLRAEQEQETRQRITEAAMKLHGTLGPARTTIRAIASEAGVQRATVYAHFPDADALFAACSGHYLQLHPPPDVSAWGAIADPDERLRVALTELYRWYAENEPMVSKTQRDFDYMPLSIREATLARVAAIREALLRGRPQRGRGRERVAAAIGHATSFFTWRSLVRDQGLAGDDAVELMVGTVDSAAAGKRITS